LTHKEAIVISGRLMAKYSYLDGELAW